jgi:hypothetical protein
MFVGEVARPLVGVVLNVLAGLLGVYPTSATTVFIFMLA